MWKQRAVMSLAVLGLWCAVSACRNPRYCTGHRNHDCRLTDAQDESCTDDGDCAAPQAICDTTGSHTCVQCTTAEHDACTGTTPLCLDTRCQACTTHAQCAASNVCLPDGSCADPAQVAYVDAAGSDTMCSEGTPCTTIMAALATTRPYLKLHGMFNEAVSIVDQAVTILADPGAKLTHTVNGILLEVKGSSHVAIYDLEVTGASGSGGFGISLPAGNAATLELRRAKIAANVAGGILMAAGTLTVAQSTVSGNTGGGITLSGGQFVIVGNVFFGNGSPGTTTGGVSITTMTSPMNRLEFNSFSKNQTQDGVGSAVVCTAGTFTARNNILSGNGTLTNMEQVGGTCSHAYSIVIPGTLPPGMGNKASDPLFVNATIGDLHIQPMSPAIQGADPASDLTGLAARDIDGDARVKPADIGADTLVRPPGSP